MKSDRFKVSVKASLRPYKSAWKVPSSMTNTATASPFLQSKLAPGPNSPKNSDNLELFQLLESVDALQDEPLNIKVGGCFNNSFLTPTVPRLSQMTPTLP